MGQILASQNEIQAFCEALKSDGFFIRHLDKADKTYDERREFFSKFQLASDRVEKLASITRAWKSDRVTVNGLTVSAQLWSEDPKCFWFGYSTDQNIIRRCLHDFNHAHTTNIIRQIIYLTILQKEVEKEQSRIDNSNVRRRSRKKGPVDRNGEFLTISLKNIAVRLWPDRDERVRNRRILQQRSLHGYKLNKLKPSGIKLALPPESLQRYDCAKFSFFSMAYWHLPDFRDRNGQRLNTKLLTHLSKPSLSIMNVKCLRKPGHQLHPIIIPVQI